MTIPDKDKREVLRLTAQGYTQKQIQDKTGVSARQQRRWKQEGYRGTQTLLNEPNLTKSSKDQKPGREEGYTWPDIDTLYLVEAGFDSDVTQPLLATLGIAREQGNDRLHRFIQELSTIRKESRNIPGPWRALLAGFHIVAEDINSPCLHELVDVVRETYPYVGKDSRRKYHRRSRHLIKPILAEAQDTIQSSIISRSKSVNLLIVEDQVPERSVTLGPFNKATLPPWSRGIDAFTDSQAGNEQPVMPNLETAWSLLLYDIVSRLPDPDRQRGKVLKELDLSAVLYLWCLSAPLDLVTKIPDKDR